MANTANLLRAAKTALTPRDGHGGRITRDQSSEATAHAQLAIAINTDRIATALEALVADTVTAAPTGVPVTTH